MLKILTVLLLMIGSVAQAKIIEIVSLDQHQSLIKSGIPMVIMMGAEWCGYCREAKPAFAEADAIYDGKVIFAYVDVDKVSVDGINGIPSYIIGGDLNNPVQRDTLNQNSGRDVQSIIEYVKRFTGVLP